MVKKQFPNALFGEPERISGNPFTPSPGLKTGMIQDNYIDSKNANTYKSMNQALIKTKEMDKYILEPNEKIGICYDVRREAAGVSNNASTSVLGRFVVSNYRLRFIENGKRETTKENYYSCSMPFGCI